MNRNEQTSPDPELKIKAAINKLRKAGLRITRPRRAILKLLHSKQKPVTADEIHQQLDPGLCDLATIYRCLTTFQELSLVRLCHFHNGTGLYEIDRGPDHQHHIVCTECNKIESLDFCVLDGIERLVRDRGYQNVSHTLGFFGICGDCTRKTG